MNYSSDKTFGNNVARLRVAAGLTQEQLAARLQTRGCDITRSALAKTECGQRHFYVQEIAALKEALGASYDELFDGVCAD